MTAGVVNVVFSSQKTTELESQPSDNDTKDAHKIATIS